MVRVLRWLGCDGLDTMMVELRWSEYYDGWAVVVMILRWLDCGCQGTTMVAL